MHTLSEFLMRAHLQLFAEGAAAGDGGEGGSASATGESTGDAGQTNNAARSLEELGVPRQAAEKYRARKAKMQEAAKAQEEAPKDRSAEPANGEGENSAPPAEPEDKGQDAAAAGYKWDDVRRDPEINRKLQETVAARTKNLREAFKDLAPALNILGGMYGLDLSDMSKADFKAFAKAVQEDDKLFENKALEMGVDVKTAKRLESLEADKRRRDAEDAQRQRDDAVRAHLDRLKAQAAEMKKQFPDFDLDRELQNPAFFRMTSPEGGLNIKQAYYACHADEITAAKEAETARKVSAAISNSIRAGQKMPEENGAGRKAAAGVTVKPYSQMNAQERAVYRRQLQSGQLRF